MMQDINGIEIKVGQIVKTKQPSGGILPPAPEQTGEVCYNGPDLCIRFTKDGDNFYRYIKLENKINEVL
jgi:hypothetical protein